MSRIIRGVLAGIAAMGTAVAATILITVTAGSDWGYIVAVPFGLVLGTVGGLYIAHLVIDWMTDRNLQ